MSKCGNKCEIYSRVTGYMRPVSAWNKGKKEEFKDRQNYENPVIHKVPKSPSIQDE